MKMTRQVFVDIPKAIHQEFKSYMKPGDTKDQLYSGLLNLGLFTFQEGKPFKMFQLPLNARTEQRKMYLVDEENITKCYPGIPLSDACVALMLIGVEVYKQDMTDQEAAKKEAETSK